MAEEFIWLDSSDGMKKHIISDDWSDVVNQDISIAIGTHAALPDAHHPQEHTHPTLGNINFTGTISSGGETGLTGTRTIAGYTLTFKNGLLVGFQAP